MSQKRFQLLVGGQNAPDVSSRGHDRTREVVGPDINQQLLQAFRGYQEGSGATVAQMAETMDVDEDLLRSWLDEEIEDIPSGWINRIAVLGGCSPAELFGVIDKVHGQGETDAVNIARGAFARLGEDWPIEFAWALKALGPILAAEPALGHPLSEFMRMIVVGAKVAEFKNIGDVERAVERAVAVFEGLEVEYGGWDGND